MKTRCLALVLFLVPLLCSCAGSPRPALLDVGNLGNMEDVVLRFALAEKIVQDKVGCNVTVTMTANSQMSSNSGILFWRPPAGHIFRTYTISGNDGSGTLLMSLHLRNHMWSVETLDFEDESLLPAGQGDH